MKTIFVTFLLVVGFASVSRADVVVGECGDHYLSVSYRADSNSRLGTMQLQGDSVPFSQPIVVQMVQIENGGLLLQGAGKNALLILGDVGYLQSNGKVQVLHSCR